MLTCFTVATSAELICFLMAIFTLITDKDLAWRSFILFLCITCITEYFGYYIVNKVTVDPNHTMPNTWLYNIYTFFEISFISIMFLNIFKHYSFNLFIKIGGIFLLIIYIIDIWIFTIYKDLVFTPVVMDILFTIYCFYYFYLIMKEERFINLKYHAPFWWVIGTMFYFFGSSTQDIILPHIKNVNFIHSYSIYINSLLAFNSLIIYGYWCYSFICKRWLMKIS